MRLVRENLRVYFYESNKSVHPVDRVDTLPEDIVAKTLRPDRPSDFTRFLATLFDPIILEGLLGKYLLPLFPEKPVALVESEKTAIICAGLIPKFIWLATGGKSQRSLAWPDSHHG